MLGIKQGEIHREMQALWDREPDSYIEIPRGHGKTLQSAAADAFDVGHDPNIRIKYVQQNDDEATKTASAIRAIIESQRYKAVFPEIKPDLRNWGKTSFTVQRSIVSRDPTLEACSIFGRAGGRWDLLVADDICDLQNSIQKPALRDQVKEAWANTWAPMADNSGGKVPRVRKLATPWHIDDQTAEWRKYHEPRGTMLRRPCDGFKSPWPEGCSEEVLRAFKEKFGSVAFSRAYLLQPLSSQDVPIRSEWIRFYQPGIAANLTRYCGFDLAYTDKTSSDFSVFIDIGVDCDGTIYLLRVLRMKAAYPEVKRAALAFLEGVRWVEIRGLASGAEIGIMDDLRSSIDVPLSQCDKMSKYERASLVAPIFESGRVHMPGSEGIPDPEWRIVFDELTQFPIAAHDDCLDAVCNALELAGKTAQVSFGFL